MPRKLRIRKADFPAIADATDATAGATAPVDAYDASRALVVLYRLASDGLAKVYIPAGWHGTQPQRWNVWLEITARRVELRAWVREWLASQEDDGQEGEAGA